MDKSTRENTAMAGGTMVGLGVAGKTAVGASLAKAAGAGLAGTKAGAAAALVLASNPVTLIGLGVATLAVAAFWKKK